MINGFLLRCFIELVGSPVIKQKPVLLVEPEDGVIRQVNLANLDSRANPNELDQPTLLN